MSDVLAIFERLGSALRATDEQWVSFSLHLGKPSVMKHVVAGFLDEKEGIEPKIFEKKIEFLLGVASNFSYSMYGSIQYPDDFNESPCILEVNPLGESDYIEYASQGLIGHGNVEDGIFRFTLCIAPDVARSIIEWRLLTDKVEADSILDELLGGAEENDPAVWIRLRVDAVNYRNFHSDDRASGKVRFNLKRLYSPG